MGSKFSSGRRKESKSKENDAKKRIRERLRLLKKKSSRETARLNAHGSLFLYLLGDKNTGKTSLLDCICPSSSIQNRRTTFDVNIKGHKFKSIIIIHDRRQMMTKTDGVLLLYVETCSLGRTSLNITNTPQVRLHKPRNIQVLEATFRGTSVSLQRCSYGLPRSYCDHL